MSIAPINPTITSNRTKIKVSLKYIEKELNDNLHTTFYKLFWCLFSNAYTLNISIQFCFIAFGDLLENLYCCQKQICKRLIPLKIVCRSVA